MNTRFKVVSALLAVMLLLSALCISAYADEREKHTVVLGPDYENIRKSIYMWMEEMVCGDMARALDSAGLSL